MKEVHIYCDKCKNEVNYYLITRYTLDETLRDIVQRRFMIIEHLCEPCMDNLNKIINDAVELWKNTV